MIEYLFLLLLIVLFINLKKRMSKGVCILCLSILYIYITLLFGLRFRVGIDTINYMSHFDELPSISSFFDIDWAENKMEPGFLLLLILCKSIIKDFWFAQLIIAALTNACILIFIYRHCKNPFIGVMVYYFLAMFYFSTEILRESLAIGIFLLNFSNFEKSNWKKFYLLCFLSLIFHYSSIITLLFPLVRFLKINFLYITSCVLFILIAPLFDVINSILTITTIASRVNSYILQAEVVNLNFRLFFLIQLMPPAICIIYLSYKKDKNNVLIKFILLHILFCCGVFAIPIIFSRFTNYTLPFVIVCVANLLCKYSLKKTMRVLLFTITLSSQLMYYSHHYYRWIPYISIFNPIKIDIRESSWWYESGQYS